MTQPFNPFASASEEDDNDLGFTEPFSSNSTPVFEQPVVETPVVTATFTPPNANKKYNIVDMYWLINNKLFNKQKLDANEVALLSIGYNADFNNLRFVIHEINDKVFTESAILKHEAKVISSVNVFSETSAKVLNNIKRGITEPVHNFERVFNANMIEQWKPNQASFEINKENGGSIILKILYNNTTYSYMFTDWQIEVLISCFKFMTNGDSWKSSIAVK